jgi:hypothetical protein
VHKLFEPLWKNPDDADVQKGAEWLFSDKESPWIATASQPAPQRFATLGDLVSSPLIGLKAFQNSVRANLKEKSDVGTVEVLEGHPQIKFHSGEQAGFGLTDSKNPLVPKPGEKRSVRVCDWYAFHLSRLQGSPVFELFWPLEKKDAAIEEFAQFVQAWGDRFRYDQSNPPHTFVSTTAHMTFPVRDRPATKADVEAGTAIFAFDASLQPRVVKMDRWPTPAKWTTLTKFVELSQVFDEKTGEGKVVSEPDQEGVIWQAEEVLENGQWKRYYGFVGHHIIAKVPADEIELLKQGRW